MSVIKNTYLPYVDGMDRDSSGYTYLANCSTNTAYKYDSVFSYPPEIFSTGHAAPLGIHINQLHGARVYLEIFDAGGRRIDKLDGGYKPAGPHQICWQAEKHPSGTYYYRLQAGSHQSTGRMLRIW